MSVSNLDRSHFPQALAPVYDWLNGSVNITTKANVAAAGTITFATNPANNTTITLGGTTVTFVTSGATGNQVNIAGSLAATLTALNTFLNASADTNIAKATYAVSATVLSITSKAVGAAGNAFTLAASVATVSGGTLAGGVTNATSAGFLHYETAYVTSGSGKVESVTIGTTPAVMVGQNKLFTLAAKGVSGDSVVFTDPASFAKGALTVSAVVLTNVNDHVLVSFRNGKWEILSASAGVVTAA